MEFDLDYIEHRILIELYKTMVKIRKSEEKVSELLLSGEIIAPTHLYIGQEAVAAGVIGALDKSDYVFSNYRGHGHYIAKGGDLKKMFAELYGKYSGCSKGKGGSMHLVAPEVSIPFVHTAMVGSQIAHAVGAALSIKLTREKRVSVVFFGDGATDTGIFYESLNFAALKKLPVIFVCENNFYSSHAHLKDRQASKDLHLNAQHIMPSYQMDGNNVIELFKKTQEAVERAKNGLGPTFVECITYRHRGHVGPNLDVEDRELTLSNEERGKWAKLSPIKLVEKATRSKEELQKWLEKDPIVHFENHMIDKKILSIEEKNVIHKKLEDEIDNAVEFARNDEYPPEDQLTSDVYAE